MAKTYAAAIVGVSVQKIEIETVIGSGFSGLSILGLGGEASRDLRERVKSALEAAGFAVPARRTIVNVNPTQVLKLMRTPVAHLDFAIAASIIMAILEDAEHAAVKDSAPSLFFGELSLHGDIRAENSFFPIAEAKKAVGDGVLCVPSRVKGSQEFLRRYSTLAEWYEDFLQNYSRSKSSSEEFDACEVSSLESQRELVVNAIKTLRRNPVLLTTVLVAAAGRHHVLVAGEPGIGKTHAFLQLRSLLENLDAEECEELQLIYDENKALKERPFRAPHHSTSMAALIGGAQLRPGEITLAHLGVLFLDELAEFPRTALEALREPLDSGSVSLSKANGSVKFPARFQLCAATNPCPCGFLLSRKKPCHCGTVEKKKYLQKLSGPLLDRFCMQVFVDSRVDLFGEFLLSLTETELESFALHFLKIRKHGHSVQPHPEPFWALSHLSLRAQGRLSGIWRTFHGLFPNLVEETSFSETVQTYRNLENILGRHFL